MKKLIHNRKILIGVLLSILVVVIGVGVFVTKENTAAIEKEEIVLGSPDWFFYTFEEAAEKAATIVYGKVVDKGEMRGSNAAEYETDVTVDVIEWVKGDMESDQIIFLEMGGETETKVYLL